MNNPFRPTLAIVLLAGLAGWLWLSRQERDDPTAPPATPFADRAARQKPTFAFDGRAFGAPAPSPRRRVAKPADPRDEVAGNWTYRRSGESCLATCQPCGGWWAFDGETTWHGSWEIGEDGRLHVIEWGGGDLREWWAQKVGPREWQEDTHGCGGGWDWWVARLTRE